MSGSRWARVVRRVETVVLWLMVLTVVALAAFMGLHLLPDEELLPGAQAWLEQHPPEFPDDENARLYLLGMRVPEGADPIAFGRAVEGHLAELGDEYSNYYQMENLTEDEVWPRDIDSEAILPRPDYVALPEPLEVRSLEVYLEQLAQAPAPESEALDELFMARYRTLLTLPHQRRLQEHWLVVPIQPYFLVYKLQRRYHQQVVETFLAGNTREALDELGRDLAFNRMLLAESDFVTPKMLSVFYITRDLQLYSLLLDSGVATEQVTAAVAAIEPLSVAEFDMEPALRGEFVWLANGNYEYTYDGFKVGTPAHLIELARVFPYHPNAATNTLYRTMNRLVDASRLPPGEGNVLAEQALDLLEDEVGGWRLLYNPSEYAIIFHKDENGRRFHSTYSYSERLWDLDGLIRMLRIKSEIRARGLRPDDVAELLATHGEGCVYGSACVPIEWDGERLFFASRAVVEYSHKASFTTLPVPFAAPEGAADGP